MNGPVIRLYLDEDSLTHPVVEQLRAGGLDVATVESVQRRGLSDEERLAFAAQQLRVLFTKNIRDFRRLHNEYMTAGHHHFGIILLARAHYDVGSQVRGVRRLAATLGRDDMADRVEFLANWLAPR